MKPKRSTVMFATHLERYGGGTYLAGFMEHEDVAKLFFGKPVERFVVRDLHEGELSEYWAWWDTKKKVFAHVYPHRDGVEMCFPYGTQVEIDKGNGEVVNVTIEPKGTET